MVDLSSKTKNQLRELLQRIGLEEGFEKPADWCLLSGKTIRDYEGTHFHNSCLKKYFKDEPGLMVTELMPALGLTRWQFKHKPRGFWDKPERARDYLLWLQRHLNLSSIKELSVVHSTTIRDKYFGKALILKYRGDMFQIFTDLFPEIELDILEFNYPLGFFEALDTRKRFVREIGRRNNLHSAEDFSNLNHKHFNQSIVGRRLLGNVYNLAPSAAITELFPDHEYKEWQFLRVPRDFWKKKENHRRAIDWLIKDVLLITHPEDFYSIRERDFEANGLSALLRHYGGAKRAIIQNYPEHEFEEHLFEKIGKAAKRLFSILSLMYPELEIKWRYKHRQMRYTKSGYPMELDIYIPKLEFGIEYQGGQHKEMPTHWGGDSGGEIQVARDNEKREACTRMGIRLLEIWDDEWDGSPLQLASILSNSPLEQFAFPDERFHLLEGRKFLPDDPPWYQIEKDTSQKKRKANEYWEFRFNQLKDYVEGGSVLESLNEVVALTELSAWLDSQLLAKEKNKLSPSRVDLLKDLGVEFPPAYRERAWSEMYERLVKYKKHHGDTLVPHLYPNDPELGHWVDAQKVSRKNKAIALERESLLNEIGFVWVVSDHAFESNFKLLLEFKTINGHVDVPSKEKPLGTWVGNLRQRKTMGSLPESQIKRLDDIGFTWNIRDYRWNEIYRKLVSFYEEHKHSNVTKTNCSDKQLIVWSGRQRTRYADGKLEASRIKSLGKIGFVLDLHQEKWNRSYFKLSNYFDQNNHSQVSRDDDLRLYEWCAYQKQLQRQGKLSQEKIERLNKLNFVWIRN